MTKPSANPSASWRDWTQPDSRRSLILMATGAVIGLLIAGVGLFNARGTTIARTPPEDVALVNGKPILFSDYIAQLQLDAGIPYAQATEAQKAKTLRDMITEELTVQRAVELDLPGTNGDVRQALVSAMELQVAANVLAAPPDEARLREFYARNQERYRTNGTLEMREFVADNQVTAEKARATLAASPDATKARLGLKELDRVKGETFDLTAKLALGEAVYRSLEALKPGQVSAPVAQPDGVHIALVTARLPPVVPSFEDAMKTVYADYLRAARQPVEDANKRYLRKKATILIAPGFHE